LHVFFDPSWDAEVKELPLDDKGLPVTDTENPATRWEKTAYRKLMGTYGCYLATKLSKVISKLATYQFEGARAPSTRFHIKIPE
jgi:hypothetical protein